MADVLAELRGAACPAVKSYKNPKIHLKLDCQTERGVFASDDIEVGELLIVENPLCVVKAGEEKVVEYLGMAATLIGSCNGATDVANTLLKPSKIVKRNEHMDADTVVNLNSFAIGLGVDRAVGRCCSLFKHSCSPNTDINMSLHNTVLTAVAIERIKVGEECCITYISDIDQPLSIRADALKKFTGIESCNCTRCTLERG